ncbi:MAG: radical SAM protein [Leptolyngbya sp. SIO4C1]|nr:radical SAM protein [Leptolyngbya sp. SIO4C1]
MLKQKISPAQTIPNLKAFLRAPCTAGLSVSTGCSNYCSYCFVENEANRMGVPWRMRNLPIEHILSEASKLRGEIVQLPVTHDITPFNVELCIQAISELVQHNQVVVVTKPFEECIDAIIAAFSQEHLKRKITFRISISSDDDTLLRKWEPGAPLYQERFHVLKKLHQLGWRVGANIAPMLDIPNVVHLFRTLEPFCNDTIYVAKIAEGHLLKPRGALKASDIEVLRQQHADIEMLTSIHVQLQNSPAHPAQRASSAP